MKDQMSNYKKDFFLEPDVIHRGYAIYAIRTSLLAAVNELKGQIGGRVLDLACGVMPYREHLLENKEISEYIGVDLEVSDYHNKVRPDKFWDGQKIPMEDNSCDWVIATEFLEHYHDTELILSEINRVLKPGGKFFFTVPCIWPLHEVPYDEHRFTPYALQKHFENTGFSGIELKALGDINRSLAIMYGLWLDYSGVQGMKKRFFRKLFKPMFKMLLKQDTKKSTFQNAEMPSGLYGFITK